MSTGIYKDGSFYIDGQVNHHDVVIADDVHKIGKHGDTTFIFCGEMRDFESVNRFIMTGEIPDTRYFECLIWKNNALYWLNINFTYTKINHHTHYAIGDGSQMALASLDAGAEIKTVYKILNKRCLRTNDNYIEEKL